MIIGLKIKKNHLPELKKRIRMLERTSVEVGVFDKSKYRDTSYNYVTLFSYLSGGNPSKNLPPRPALQLAFTFNPLSSSPLKKDLAKYLSTINRKKSKPALMRVLEGVGKFYRNKTVRLFGNTSALASNSDFTQKWKESQGYKGNNPLIMKGGAGSLRSKVAYKIGNETFEYGK